MASPAELGRLVFPAKPEWKISETIDGRPVEFSLPAERNKILALDEKALTPILDNIKRIERNQAVAHQVSLAFFGGGSGPARGTRLTPDYERTLTEVAVSVSRVEADTANPVFRNLPILKALPSYSKIHLVMPPNAVSNVKMSLAAEQLLERSVFHDVSKWAEKKDHKTSFTRSTRWIRDTFLVGNTPDQRTVVFKPLAYAYTSDLTRSDLDCQRRLNIEPPCRSNIEPGRVAEF